MGYAVPLAVTMPDARDVRDVAVACLASVLVHLTTRTDTASWLSFDPRGRSAPWPLELRPVSPPIRWGALEHELRCIEALALAAPDADASFEIARRAVQRVRERAWWYVIDG